MMLFIPSFVWLFWAFNFTVDFVDLFRVFDSSFDFVWPFLAFDSCPFRQTVVNQLMTQAVSRRLESTQLMTQAAFQELTQIQLMTQVDSLVLIQIDSWLKMLPDFSIQINSWLKWKNSWFWVDSWFDSRPYPCLPVAIKCRFGIENRSRCLAGSTRGRGAKQPPHRRVGSGNTPSGRRLNIV